MRSTFLDFLIKKKLTAKATITPPISIYRISHYITFQQWRLRSTATATITPITPSIPLPQNRLTSVQIICFEIQSAIFRDSEICLICDEIRDFGAGGNGIIMIFQIKSKKKVTTKAINNPHHDIPQILLQQWQQRLTVIATITPLQDGVMEGNNGFCG